MAIAHYDTISWGDDGVYETIDAMANLVVASIALPIVIETARAIAGRARGQYAQAVALRTWLKGAWRFVDDPFNVELLVEPATALANAQRTGTVTGDCDEAATLGAALGAAIGLRPTFTVLAFVDESGVDRLCHVYAVLLTDDGRAVDLDITRPSSGVPAPTRELTFPVFQ